ncbi:hypothetical protein SAMN05444412_101281 [Rhodonellum ikkaensis]|uniref:Uncharacterized protein n=1 Tax=Rhodonellum ikkaensis TaxID=336829 RepID=A0A1H3K6Y7_9BACT|nr:hypothetical protein SAMN05444412_101281 [Rhodonellum ikkaensis]
MEGIKNRYFFEVKKIWGLGKLRAVAASLLNYLSITFRLTRFSSGFNLFFFLKKLIPGNLDFLRK